MKILMIDYFLPNSIYSLELCDKLSINNEVILICKDNYFFNNEKKFKILPILHSKSTNKIQAFYLYLKDLNNIWKIVKKYNPDVLHIQEVQHVFFEKKLVKKIKKNRVKTIFTAHNILSHENKRKEKSKLNSWYQVFDGIIVHNNMSKKLLLENSKYKKNIFVIPHGIYDLYKDTKKEIEKDKITFLQFGLIREYKGVDVLLDAISLLPDNIKKSTKFIVAGALKRNYYDFDIYKRVEDLKISNCVDLRIGRVDDDAIPSLFNESDFCIFPYRHIYGSGALLMAYTYNKPVIVSDIPVFIEETENGKTGMIFKKNIAEDLAQKITILYNKKTDEINQYKLNIKKLVDEKYNWTISSKLTIDAYKK